jgi:4-hydroxybenzoate polyprenyltransferase
MLTRTYRALNRTSDLMKVAIIAAMIVLLVVFHRPFSWLLLAAIISGAIDMLYPHLKRLVGLPDWTPNEAYITKLRHSHRASEEADDSAS